MPDTPDQPQEHQPQDGYAHESQPHEGQPYEGRPQEHQPQDGTAQDRPAQDRPAQGSPAQDSPPPAPWWSRPGQAVQPSAPDRESASPFDQTAAEPDPTAAQPSWGSAADQGGAAGRGGSASSDRDPFAAAQPAPRDEQAAIWGAPAATGAPAWGYPSDTFATAQQGATAQPGNPYATTHPGGSVAPKKGRGKAGFAGAILATALIAGGVGGVVGSEAGGTGSLLDSSASLGSGGTASQAVDRAPTSVAGIAARVLTSVVSISVKSASSSGTGSGVVLRSDGYIVTNNHVVQAAATGGEITVSFNDASQTDLPARIVGRDPETDLAVIKVDGRTLSPATLGQSRSLVVGDPVLAIGSPLGLAGTVTSGIISALNRTVNVPGENGARTPLFNAVQTDAAINPGNSGGALVDSGGRVIGINSAIATLGGGSSSPFGGETQSGSIGVGFAIPVDEARSVAEELIRTGKATHPAIGVEAATVGEASGSGQRGARISRLVASGSAQKAGLQAGDLITMIEGTTVHSVDELILAIREHKVGDTVTVTYVRGGRTDTAKLTLQDKTPRQSP